MIVTRKALVNKIIGYLNHRLELQELIDWAEHAMMEADFEAQHFEEIRGVIAKIGLADVKAFGLTWQDLQDFLQCLGYEAHVEAAEMA